MKHFVQRLEEYSENPEAKATGAVQWVISLCHVRTVVCNPLSTVGSLGQLGPVETSCLFVMQICTC